MVQMKKTVSLSVGNGSIAHNNRDFLTENIDPNRIEDNIVFIKQDLKDAYEELFAEAIKNYNQDKKPSRQKKDYMKEIEKSGNGEKVFQEIVVQFGDKDDTGLGTKDWEVAREALEKYAREFQGRNENVHVFNSVLHLDESTPHLHISFIPVAENYKTGLSKRNSFSKSMNDRFGNSKGVAEWFKYEREVLADLARDHNIEIEVLGEDRPHLPIKQYKETKDKIQELNQVKDKLETNVNELSQDLNTLKMQIKSRRDELEEFKDNASQIENEHVRELNERLNKQTESYDQAIQQMKNDFGDLKARAVLQNEKSNLIQENKNLKSELSQKDLVIESQNQIITHQQDELRKKDKIIAKLQKTVEATKEFIQEKASWLSGKFNDFFKNKATVEEIEALEIQEQLRTSQTIELEIKDIEKTLDDLKNEEFSLILDVDDNLEPVSELKNEFDYGGLFEELKPLESPLNAQKLQSDDVVQDEWVQVSDNLNDFTAVKESEHIPVSEKPSLISALKIAKEKVDKQQKKITPKSRDLEL